MRSVEKVEVRELNEIELNQVSGGDTNPWAALWVPRPTHPQPLQG